MLRKIRLWLYKLSARWALIIALADFTATQFKKRGLKSEKISYFGKIAAVADVFDALTTRRSYKPALSTFETLKIMKTFEGHFDPDIFSTFVLLMSKEETA